MGDGRRTPTGHQIAGHAERPREDGATVRAARTRARKIALRLGTPAQPVAAVPTRRRLATASDPLLLIDLATALHLLTAAVAVHDGRALRPGPATAGRRSLVGDVLALAGIEMDQLEELEEQPLRELWQRDRLPVRLTLGALVVLDAAQRRQEQGCSAPDILAHVTAIARCYVDLLPDRVVRSATGRAAPRPGRTQSIGPPGRSGAS